MVMVEPPTIWLGFAVGFEPVTVVLRSSKNAIPTSVPDVGAFIVNVAWPLTDTGGTYMVRAMVKNIKLNDAESSWLLYPGMQAEMNIQLRRLP